MIDRVKEKVSSMIILRKSISSYFSSDINNLKIIIDNEKDRYCESLSLEEKTSIEKELKSILNDISIKRICKDHNLMYDKRKIIKPSYIEWFKKIDNSIQVKKFLKIITNNIALNLYYNNFCGFSKKCEPILKGDLIYSEEIEKPVIVKALVNEDSILVTDNKRDHIILLKFAFKNK